MKKYLIEQPAGLGDIFYCQKIAKTLIEGGHEIYWPVIPQFSYISEYIKHPSIHFEKPEGEYSILNLLHSTPKGAPDTSIMESKYKLAGISSEDWIDYFTFERNSEKEDELYDQKVTADKYCLICNTFASPPNMVSLEIDPDTDLTKVYLNAAEGFTPFDWCKIIEKAEEIHFVDTCFTYLVEKLDVATNKLVLYPREPYHKEIITKSNWKKNWKYVTKNI